ncbi:MAG: excinuclease ABC subunit UvrA [Verrucomicrobiae bacterium]|nr:excinuclease ABC subunit UvrA [Verrucomicrobiae bacterium]NNJ42398.1 excinuclease ABC subunit UvrA [Akkermansiaceae bacterium]
MDVGVDAIMIKGARQHNLRGIDVEIPRGKLVVITGPSGSGKSSLAFHTLYAEGQRRYVESLSTYARQFLDQLDKPDVDSIDGLSPAIAIEQRSGGVNPRSTIATATEIYDYLRILYAAIGIPHDPTTGEKLEKMTAKDIIDTLSARPEKTKIVLLAPIPREESGDVNTLLENLQRQGFVRLRVNGEMLEVEDAHSQWPDKVTQLEVVVDRLVVRDGVMSRLADSVETALRICGGQTMALVMEPGVKQFDEVSFLTSYRNPITGFELPALTPKHFSFNSRHGACPLCHGLGTEMACHPDLIVPDPTESIASGAVVIWKNSKRKKSGLGKKIDALATAMGADIDAPFGDLPEAFKQALFYGSEEVKGVKFEGLCHTVERFARESKSNAVRRSMGRLMSSNRCSRCHGRRLKPEILAVHLESGAGEMLGIDQLGALSVEDALKWLQKVKISDARGEALQGVITEITRRLQFLDDVGLSYLTLDRPSHTLSGGEAQRIRLATQIGAGLSGVIYVLDEPSIGLHSADNARLIDALKRLRDMGNTVVVVEHDEDTIRAADWLIDIGPGAGSQGGELLASGKPADVAKNKNSVTGQWLAGHADGLPDAVATKKSGEIIIRNAREHNLQGVDVAIPLGWMVAVTGPSGSGKSTLIDGVLRRALARHFYHATTAPGAHDRIEGVDQLDKMVVVDQKPLGRSPRSNPATYTGALDLIRALFAKLPISRQRGYNAGRFSFNVKGGRCEKCQGGGVIRIDMHFLNDAYITCDSCDGHRYNRETLEVTYKGLNIAQVLELTAEDAAKLFKNVPKLNRILNALCDVGLGYIHLGQPANTLSGGEAQRVKLADELSRPNTGHCLYLLDEPTTGLHFNDVQVLLGVLRRLRDMGNSLVIVEHNLDVIRASDWVIDLGPGGGKHGGQIVAAGSPEAVSLNPASLTGSWLNKR